MIGKPPLVSVCVPVRNGQQYLSTCLDSILAQTFTDFEVIICDNASTDATESIAQEYAARDPRIRYVRHHSNLGPAANFNRGFELARGRYFRWHAHDDCITPDYLQECARILEENRSIALVYPQATIIDEKGQRTEDYDFHIDADTPSVPRRFHRFIMASHRQHRNFEIFGLARWAALRETPLHQPYAHGDRVLVARLILRGKFRQIHRHMFLARRHTEQSMQALPERAAQSRLTRWFGPGPLPPPEWWDPAMRGRVTFPDWNLLKEYWTSVSHAPLWPIERFCCYLCVAHWLLRYWPKLFRDLAFAAEVFVSRFLPQPTRQSASREGSEGSPNIAR